MVVRKPFRVQDLDGELQSRLDVSKLDCEKTKQLMSLDVLLFACRRGEQIKCRACLFIMRPVFVCSGPVFLLVSRMKSVPVFEEKHPPTHRAPSEISLSHHQNVMS